jgi:chemotaxis protein CheX
MNPTDKLIQKFQLAPLPGNVQRLGKLIQGGFAQNADEIAALIKADAALSAQVIAVAQRKRNVEMEVEQAVMRLGVTAITLVVMSELLMNAVTKTFSTMLNAPLEKREELFEHVEEILGSIRFSGRASGQVFLRVPATCGAWMIGRFLGEESVPEDPTEMLGDVVGELLNIVAGNFKSNLCDAGLNCDLSVPSIVRRMGFKPEVGEDQHHQLMAFLTDGLPVFLDLVITPVSA